MHCADRYVYVLSPLQLYNTYTCKYTASQKMSYHCTDAWEFEKVCQHLSVPPQ